MKKNFSLFFLLAIIIAAASCRGNNDNVKIKYSETKQSYSMKANFPENRTREVDEYYNFVKIHKTLHVPPAMEAGLIKRLMSIEDIPRLGD